MFSRTSILRNLTTNALGPKTSRKLDPGNDRRTRLGGLWRIANRDPELFVSSHQLSVESVRV
jgi:hypothetical protein